MQPILREDRYSMKIHYLQHVPFEGLGSIASWIDANGHSVTRTTLYLKPVFPAADSLDMLVILGGPMSVHDEVQFSWLSDEKKFIRKCIDLKIPVLGICLGAQLIADVLGAPVYRNPVKEIGWFPIMSTGTTADATHFSLPQSCTVFHWHGETFDLPEGAVRLAESNFSVNQAFQYGKNVIGLQFHLETTRRSAEEIVAACRDELLPDICIQCEEEILAVPESLHSRINALMYEVLEYLSS